MKRDTFMQQPDVIAFVTWLRDTLPKRQFQLNMKSSRYVPGGLKMNLTGLEKVLEQYRWKTSVTGTDDADNNAGNWASTTALLQSFHIALDTAVQAGDEDAALATCMAILRWGGVRGAVPFIHRLHGKKALTGYLKEIGTLMALDAHPSQELNDLNATTVKRFDAGLTKIHAILSNDGLPIVDSRVGAAVSMLYELYRRETATTVKRALKFPTGSARGKQIRNPGEFGGELKMAPTFYTRAVSHESWARSSVQLGWIMRAVLGSCEWFKAPGNDASLAARCHAFEASLFMIGYDLRCFGAVPEQVEAAPVDGIAAAAEIASRGWVPTGSTLSIVLPRLVEFRRMHGAASIEKFYLSLEILSKAKDKRAASPTDEKLRDKNRRAAARSACFPLSENEFDLFNRDLATLKKITVGGEAGLLAATHGEPWSHSMTEREQVCLVDVRIAGAVASLTKAEQQTYLISRGWAGTPNAANTLISMGRNVGKYFGLLDKQGKPTEWYYRFFQTTPDTALENDIDT
ncbi:hypothetical protein [Actimicrobium antarcticum]|uniref:Uncharacterized protein n=1 Tax=Actimicrobium antarcticum TaxID=1051899 RepID=A0ABP7TRS3_9BURK